MSRDRTNSKGSLAETKVAEEWLQQFDSVDVETVRLLLDSLVFISNQELILGIKKCINDFLDKYKGKVAIYVAREVPQAVRDYWKFQEKNRGINRILRELEEAVGIRKPSKDEPAKVVKEKAPMYFENKKCRPKTIDVSSKDGIGSEGTFAHLCRDICAANSRLLNHPSLSGMKRSKCRWILCIDDIIGSGKRMDEFIKWLNMHPTIKSWRSFGWLKFATISYAVSEKGLDRLKDCNIIKEIQYSKYMPSGRTFWTQLQHKNISDLCKKYGKRTTRKRFACGFGESLSLIVFEHKCPNTAPAILWAPSSDKWKSIFDERPGIVLERWPKANREYNQERILKYLGHTRLCKPSLFTRLNVESQQLLVLLASLAVKKRKINILSDILELPQNVIIDMVAKCHEFGWINSKLYLTNTGHKTLEAAKKNLCLPKLDVELKDEFYYPKALRNSASSFSSGSSEEELL